MLTLGTWNIHRCIGSDGRYAPRRIRSVLRRLDTDLIALQEVELFHNDPELLDFLCEGSSWQALMGVTEERTSGLFGNALLTRLPLLWSECHDVSQPNREPRGAIQAVLSCEGSELGVLATHLGLRGWERRRQLARLLGLATGDSEAWSGRNVSVLALLGDFNNWSPVSGFARQMRRRFGPVPAHATWPASKPRLALDRILLDPADRLLSLGVVDDERTRIASDHLPLLAQVAV